MARTVKAIHVAMNPSKFPKDLESIDNALADTPAEAARMRAEREEQQIIESARSGMPGRSGFDPDAAGW